jgi:hypothetical protein
LRIGDLLLSLSHLRILRSLNCRDRETLRLHRALSDMYNHNPGWFFVSSKATADIGYQALVPAIIFTALALVAVLLRLYTRTYLVRRVGLEDVFLVIAVVRLSSNTGTVETLMIADSVNGFDRYCLWW